MKQDKLEEEYLLETKKRLSEDAYYNRLIIRKKALLTYLGATIEEKKYLLLKKYCLISQKMKSIELEATLKVLVSDLNKKIIIKNDFDEELKEMFEEAFEEAFEEKFNKLLKDNSNYTNQLNNHILIYDSLVQNSEYEFFFNDIQKIESEMACIETDTLKNIYYSVEV